MKPHRTKGFGGGWPAATRCSWASASRANASFHLSRAKTTSFSAAASCAQLKLASFSSSWSARRASGTLTHCDEPSGSQESTRSGAGLLGQDFSASESSRTCIMSSESPWSSVSSSSGSHSNPNSSARAKAANLSNSSDGSTANGVQSFPAGTPGALLMDSSGQATADTPLASHSCLRCRRFCRSVFMAASVKRWSGCPPTRSRTNSESTDSITGGSLVSL
mmetsp:Transcript_35803/g.82170  ORF Transcript_35803/g.82170 Transcript_35803/m.82170 type:complete len:221 (+) Transcript_35803:345-1007(+)